MYYFQAYGLTCKSELYFPQSVSSSLDPVAVHLLFGKVSPLGLAHPVEAGCFYQAASQMVWLHVPNIGRFLIENGTRITIDPCLGVDEASLRLFIGGPCFASLLMQRGLFVLKGAALCQDSAVITFLAESNGGASSIAAYFLQKNYSILCDNYCVMDLNQHVFSGFPQLDLWEDTLQRLNMSKKGLVSVRPSLKKYGFPLAERLAIGKFPLKKMIFLKSYSGSRVKKMSLSPFDKIKFLQRHWYNKHYLIGLGLQKLYFQYCMQFAATIDMVLIERPLLGFQIKELGELIETTLLGEEVVHSE